MEIRILSAGKEIGPYSESQVRQYLGEGLVASSDLASHDGASEWQALDHLLAQLPPEAAVSAPAPETVPESRASGPLPKTKRIPIVLQPVFAPEGSAPATTRRPRTGRTALNIEPPRPTTQLPPVAKFTGREEARMSKSPSPRPVIETDLLAPSNFFERPAGEPVLEAISPASELVTELAEPAPLAPEQPAQEAPQVAHDHGEPRDLSTTVIAAGLALLALIVCLLAALVYFLFTHVSGGPAKASITPAVSGQPEQTVAVANPTSPHSSADYSARGFIRQSKGDLDAALADYDQAVDLDARNAQALYRRAVARQTKGKWDGALADYNAQLKLTPANADALSNRGYVKQALGDTDGALADYQQALRLNPRIAIAYYNVGLIKVQKRDLDGAIEAYNHAIDFDPAMAVAYYNRGNAKNAEGNLDGAIADYTQALTLNSSIALAYCNRGFARQSKGDSAGALADYSQAITLNPKLSVAFYNRGLIKVQRGDLEGSIADSARAIDLDPNNAQAYCNRGLALLGQGSWAAAEADLRRYSQLAPRDSGTDAARLYLWIIAMKQNARSTADSDLASAVANDWNSSPEEITSKIAAFLLGHTRESELIANAASPDPAREPAQYCKAWYFIGAKRELAGDTVAATAAFQKSIATNQKDFCEYLFARAELTALGQSRQASAQPAPTAR